ncbi:hypothetical protein AB0G15_05810 [Streptosporangium sp. NPDC023825]|uniref:hypothetical protein n=1 Tax=Streptosporangium sp. NPDC023825 TaxID=3154909 RepID=UPI00343FCB84
MPKYYTCGFCGGEIKGDMTSRTVSDDPTAPREARHKNGKCENKNYQFVKDGDGTRFYWYTYRDVAFTWKPGTSQIRVNGYGPEGDVNIGVRDLATGKITLPSEMRAFVLFCEEWFSGMNGANCIHCDKEIKLDSEQTWRTTDSDSEECEENNGNDHRPPS